MRPGARERVRRSALGRWAVLGTLAFLVLACGRRAQESPSPTPSPSPVPIRAPDASLHPIVPPPKVGLDAGGLQRIRRRELYLEGVIAAGGAGKEELALAYGELGKVYHAFGLPDSAVPCYENAARLQPSAFEWPYLLARAHWRSHRAEEALAAVEKALALRPDDLPALVLLGDLHRATGQVERAQKAYARAVEVSPRCAPALYGLGEIASLTGDFPRAIRLFESALQVQPEASRIHYPLSLAYARVGQPEKAKRHLAQRGSLDPAIPDPFWDAMFRLNPFTYARRGQEAMQAGDMRTAMSLLRTAREALPDDAEIRMALGATLAHVNDFAGALEEYREAVRLRPTDPRTHYNFGTTLSKLGRDEEALVPLRRAVELHPEFRQAVFNLGQALRRLDRLPEALPLLQETLRLTPTHEPARLALARVQAKLGRCREAVAGLEQGLTVAPASRDIKAFLARLLAACTADAAADPARALRLAEEVFGEEATAAHATTLAFVHAARGAWPEAARWQRRAIALLPKNQPADAETLTAQLRAYEAQRLAVEW